MQTASIVVAAGRGERASGERPKQYQTLLGEPVLRRAIRAFAQHPAIDAVQPVIDPTEDEAYRSADRHIPKYLTPATGGATRQQSVRAGLEALVAEKPAIVLIHDAARPLVSSALIDRALAAVSETGAAVPVVTLPDTVKDVVESGLVVSTVDRR